ncbi:MAG: hypothetical protein DMF09_06790 [Verrucomicrobia bacterium]|nr:MAG: hypothetical protein DMF09_06790 [Verrucomicrobiota bacterium]
MEVGITVVSTIATSMIRSSSLAILEVRSFTIRIPYYGYYGYDSYNQPGYPGGTGYTDSLVGQVQRSLARAGYYHGSIDGVNGNGTRRAIREYERAHGLPGDGKIGQQLLTTMGLS